MRTRLFHFLLFTLPGLGAVSCSKSPPAVEAARPALPVPKPVAKKVEDPFPKPEFVKGIYLTAWTAGGTKKLDRLLAMIGRTELNAVVIDVRDSGQMYFKTGIPLAEESGATTLAVADPKALFEKLREHKVYPIARIACFRDKYVPKKHPELAVRFKDGRLWKDRSGNTWLDPYNRKNWEYLAQTVDFAVGLGFAEIQLDYVRFPSEGRVSSMAFPGKASYPDKEAKPGDVIARFCAYLRKRVKERGKAFSADIFGIISSGTADQGIGQTLEKVAAPFDVVCPMVYPSHYARGEYGIANPHTSPYAIVKKSLMDFKRRLPKGANVRPWLQDFSLFRVRYGAPQVKAQIKAARECGYQEYLLWNAGNRYTEAALAPEKPSNPSASPKRNGADRSQ